MCDKDIVTVTVTAAPEPSQLELALELIANLMPLAALNKGVLDFTKFRNHVPYSYVINTEPNSQGVSTSTTITIRTRIRS
jgi:hypothetical protein